MDKITCDKNYLSVLSVYGGLTDKKNGRRQCSKRHLENNQFEVPATTLAFMSDCATSANGHRDNRNWVLYLTGFELPKTVEQINVIVEA